MKQFLRQVVIAAGLVVGTSLSTAASAQTIVDEWANVKAPPPPVLKPVTIDPKTTALLMLDFMNQNCGKRPRCLASVPAVKNFLAEARVKGMMVVYTTGPSGKVADTLEAVAPAGSEPVVSAGVDKFLQYRPRQNSEGQRHPDRHHHRHGGAWRGAPHRQRGGHARNEGHRSGGWHVWRVGRHLHRTIHGMAPRQRAGVFAQCDADEVRYGQVLTAVTAPITHCSSRYGFSESAEPDWLRRGVFGRWRREV